MSLSDNKQKSSNEKAISSPFKRFNSMGEEEKRAASEVIESGKLSNFLGEWHEDFYGGTKVKEFEKACSEFFCVENAVTFNSWTSGLVAAMGSIGLEPGDEVIVPTWTMCATATSVLHWNAVPIFADIEKDTFNICPASVERNINRKTKAIIAVDIFGQSADIKSLRALSKRYNLKLISDSAQAPGSMVGDKFAGTLSDIGGYSLNYHKHINTGEGGVLVTDDAELAEKTRLIRNHAEAVVGPKGEINLANMIGHNFRLGEIESAIGIEQLKKLKRFVAQRQEQAKFLTEKLSTFKGLKVPVVTSGQTHSYYIYGLIFDANGIGISKELIATELALEGLDLILKYQNIHLLPMFQEKIAYGTGGFPWTFDGTRKDIDYSKGICPVAEELNDKTFLGLVLCLYDLTQKDLQSIINAFEKVWTKLKIH